MLNTRIYLQIFVPALANDGLPQSVQSVHTRFWRRPEIIAEPLFAEMKRSSARAARTRGGTARRTPTFLALRPSRFLFAAFRAARGAACAFFFRIAKVLLNEKHWNYIKAFLWRWPNAERWVFLCKTRYGYSRKRASEWSKGRQLEGIFSHWSRAHQQRWKPLSVYLFVAKAMMVEFANFVLILVDEAALPQVRTRGSRTTGHARIDFWNRKI